ncbi:MAG TPA: PorP/SprF family type IX secretion system membrane protein, partial [Flavobacterium sp.]|uniref:PorP/SprF family type IX secretion system membrane protein n=1 Tax=Flavobacterium sp. TaxID=239 RepID=UPI002BB2F8EC
MKKTLLLLAFLYGSFQMLYSQNQEDGVVSFRLPVRNSLKFNKFLLNPTFSFVKEQGATLSFYNKRQWVQFDDAPQTYLFSYSGRFKENEGVSLGLFQQNYGVLTTFGGVANFAHNVVLQQDSNLTFGLNVGFYKSGLNKGAVVSNNVDPSLENIPSNSLITINPGINYGIGNLDFGVSMNNLFLYNIKSSKMVEDDPEKSIQAHIMHTGYINSYGFFDKSKFSALVSSDFKKEKTVISGLMMFAVPKGIWIQAGYNTVYGASGGLGMNVTPRISIEYNFEKGLGDLTNFGSSHEIVFAYKFKSKNYYYGDEEEEGAIIPATVKRYVPTKPKEATVLSPIDANKLKEQKAADAKAKADVKAKADALAQAQKAKEAADAKAKADALAQAQKAKEAADAKAKADALAQAQKAKEAADAKAK